MAAALRWAGCVAVVLLIAGCGGKTAGSGLKPAISNWTAAAAGYNQAIARCARRPTPAPGFWDGCTRAAKRKLASAASDALKASHGCKAAAGLPALIRAESAALGRESHWNQQLLDDLSQRRPYTGPNLSILLGQTAATTKRTTGQAARITC